MTIAKSISQLEASTTTTDDDLLVIVQDSANYKINRKDFLGSGENSIIDSEYGLAVGFGYNNTASGYYSVVFGFDNTASDDGAVAIGNGCVANDENAVAVGGSGFIGNEALGEYSAVFGYDNHATDDSSTAIGNFNQATNQSATAIGNNNTASGVYSIAAGYDNTASSYGTSVFGQYNNAIGTTSVAIGFNNSAENDNSLALGIGCSASGNYAIAIGYQASATDDHAIAVGGSGDSGISANGEYSAAFGYDCLAQNDNSTSIGNFNQSTNIAATTIGYENEASGEGATAAGYSNSVSTYQSCAFGSYNQVSGEEKNTAIGWSNSVQDRHCTAVGYSNSTYNNYSNAFGYENVANDTSANAMGSSNTASGSGSTGVGYSNIASGNGSTAVGYNNTASGLYSTALGSGNVANSDNSTVIGIANTVESGNDSSQVFGGYNTVSGYASIIFGFSNTSDDNGIAAGFYNNAGKAGVAIGQLNYASAIRSSAIGEYNFANSGNVQAIGGQNIAGFINLDSQSYNIIDVHCNPLETIDVDSYITFEDSGNIAFNMFQTRQNLGIETFIKISNTFMNDGYYFVGSVSISEDETTVQILAVLQDNTNGSFGEIHVGSNLNFIGGSFVVSSVNTDDNFYVIDGDATSIQKFIDVGINVYFQVDDTYKLFQVSSVELSEEGTIIHTTQDISSSESGNLTFATTILWANNCDETFQVNIINVGSNTFVFDGDERQVFANAEYIWVDGDSNETSNDGVYTITGVSYNEENTTVTISGELPNSSESDNYGSAMSGTDVKKANWKEIAVGYKNTSIGYQSTAVGINNTASSFYTTAVGNSNTISGCYSQSFGFYNIINNENSIAVGMSNTVSGYSSLAIGRNNTASGDYSIAAGYNTTSSYYSTISIGINSSADDFMATSFGQNSHATNTSALALGNENAASGVNSSAIGNENTASGEYSVAAGYNNGANENNTVAIGINNTASDVNAVSVGVSNTVNQNSASAFGYNNEASNNSASALGYSNTASGTYSTAIGYNNEASNNGSSALGYLNTASAYYSTAIGFNAQARIDNTVNIGGSIIVRKDNDEDSVYEVQAFAGAENIIMSKVVDLTNTSTTSFDFPEGCSFFPDECGLIITHALNVSGQPTVEFGDEDAADDLVSAIQTTSLTAFNNRQKFTDLSNNNGHTTLSVTITIGGTADNFTGRFYWKGMLIEDTIEEVPFFDNGTGSYISALNESIDIDYLPDSTIYYTTDGSAPNTESTEYSGSFDVIVSQTITAVAVSSRGQWSEISDGQVYDMTCATPTFDPVAGSYDANQSVTINDTTPGATIYYTTDGSDPTDESTEYTEAVSIEVSTILKAIAILDGANDSSIGSAIYTLFCDDPEFSIDTGSFDVEQSLTLTSNQPIYYTTDGSTPDSDSTLYTEAITIDVSETIKAISIQDGWTSSSVISKTYTLICDDPAFSVDAGTYDNTQSLTLSSNKPIYYTTDGSDPDDGSTIYNGSFDVDVSETIKAIAIWNGWTNSNIISKTYTFVCDAPSSFSPSAGIYLDTQSVTITSDTTGATIYYTTDDSDPTIESTLYSGAFDVSTTETVKAIAVKSGYTDSSISSADYVIDDSGLPILTTDSFSSHFNFTATVGGTVLFQGDTSLTEYGFVWNTTGSPTLSDNVVAVGTGSFTGSFSQVISVGGSTAYVRAYATNGTGTGYGNTVSGFAGPCLIRGTKVSLADGTKKNIEDITYNDNLLVWNFDEGKLDNAKPVWMVIPWDAPEYAMVKFSDGSELGTVNDGKGHRIFNMEKQQFAHLMNEDTDIGTSTFKENGEIVNVISRERVKKPTTFYNIITDKHINVFANDILTSTGLNNIYPIVDMKFIKNDKMVCWGKDDFIGISDEIFNGFRLTEQPLDYPELQLKINRLVDRQQ